MGWSIKRRGVLLLFYLHISFASRLKDRGSIPSFNCFTAISRWRGLLGEIFASLISKFRNSLPYYNRKFPNSSFHIKDQNLMSTSRGSPRGRYNRGRRRNQRNQRDQDQRGNQSFLFCPTGRLICGIYDSTHHHSPDCFQTWIVHPALSNQGEAETLPPLSLASTAGSRHTLPSSLRNIRFGDFSSPEESEVDNSLLSIPRDWGNMSLGSNMFQASGEPRQPRPPPEVPEQPGTPPPLFDPYAPGTVGPEMEPVPIAPARTWPRIAPATNRLAYFQEPRTQNNRNSRGKSGPIGSRDKSDRDQPANANQSGDATPDDDALSDWSAPYSVIDSGSEDKGEDMEAQPAEPEPASPELQPPPRPKTRRGSRTKKENTGSVLEEAKGPIAEQRATRTTPNRRSRGRGRRRQL